MNESNERTVMALKAKSLHFPLLVWSGKNSVRGDTSIHHFTVNNEWIELRF